MTQNQHQQGDILLAQANTDPGFKVPGSGTQPTPPDGADNPTLSTTPPGTPVEIAPVAGAPAADTSTRELVIGGGIFLVLLIAFFFVRNAYTHHLVVRRVAPSAAGSAGWLLFVGLNFLSAAAVLAIINASKFLSWAITAPLLLVGLGALVGALLVGRR